MATPSARFSRRRENFSCEHCGQRVVGTGYTNHCPACLWSKHVDVAPGDRAAPCQGLMEPIGVLFEAGAHVVVQRCTVCGHLWRNRSSAADSTEALAALMGRPVPDTASPPRRPAHDQRTRPRR